MPTKNIYEKTRDVNVHQNGEVYVFGGAAKPARGLWMLMLRKFE